jgi:hypothetical protein
MGVVDSITELLKRLQSAELTWLLGVHEYIDDLLPGIAMLM